MTRLAIVREYRPAAIEGEHPRSRRGKHEEHRLQKFPHNNLRQPAPGRPIMKEAEAEYAKLKQPCVPIPSLPGFRGMRSRSAHTLLGDQLA